jgi:hypothetical protein
VAPKTRHHADTPLFILGDATGYQRSASASLLNRKQLTPLQNFSLQSKRHLLVKNRYCLRWVKHRPEGCR